MRGDGPDIRAGNAGEHNNSEALGNPAGLHSDLKSYQPPVDQSSTSSRDCEFGISPAADFSKVKLSLLETVTEKVPTFAV